MSPQATRTSAKRPILSPSALGKSCRFSDGESEHARDPNTAVKRTRHLQFTTVQVMTYSPEMDASKLPTDGPGVGLGELQSVSIRRLASFEDRTRQGVHRFSAEDRRAALISFHRSESIDSLERELEEVKRQRAETVAELDETTPRFLDKDSNSEDMGISDLFT